MAISSPHFLLFNITSPNMYPAGLWLKSGSSFYWTMINKWKAAEFSVHAIEQPGVTFTSVWVALLTQFKLYNCTRVEHCNSAKWGLLQPSANFHLWAPWPSFCCSQYGVMLSFMRIWNYSALLNQPDVKHQLRLTLWKQDKYPDSKVYAWDSSRLLHNQPLGIYYP